MNSRAFRKYFFSYAALFIFILMLMFSAVMWQTVENMKAEEFRLTENKLYTVAEDMEYQMESLQLMAIDIASRENFRLNYFQADKYREIELLELLKDYKKSTDICNSYFLYYTDHAAIFTSTGKTMPLSVYCVNEFGKNAPDFAELLNTVSIESAEKIVLHRQGNNTMILFPLKKIAASSIGREGVLCVRISEEKLLERIEGLVGIMRGNISVYYNDFCFFEETDNEIKNTYELMSQAGHFKICFYPETDSYFSWGNVISLREILFFVGIAFVLGVVGFIMACWNFSPLRVLAEKYGDRTADTITAEWESLDRLIDTLLNGNERSNQKLEEQYRLLREQTIRLIASGGYCDRVQEYMTLLNIRLEASVYGVVKCILAGKKDIEKDYTALFREIEDLSGDGIALYPYWNSSDSVHVLITAEEEYQLEEAGELLDALFAAKNVQVRIEYTGTFRRLEQIHQNADAETEPKPADEAADKASAPKSAGIKEKLSGINRSAEPRETGKRRNNTAKDALKYIRENCNDYNLSLDLIARELQVTPAYLSRIIKQKTGMSYKEYLTGLRIEEAKKMLLDQNMSVMDVCQNIGYVNVSYFIKIFQEYTGMTPARFRDEREELIYDECKEKIAP